MITWVTLRIHLVIINSYYSAFSFLQMDELTPFVFGSLGWMSAGCRSRCPTQAGCRCKPECCVDYHNNTLIVAEMPQVGHARSFARFFATPNYALRASELTS